MSCAAVMIPRQPNQLGVFRGDAEGMVDLLVEACLQKPLTSSYTGFGRDLVPWCDDDVPAPSSSSLSARRPQHSKFPAGSHKHPRSSAEYPTGSHKLARSGAAPGSPTCGDAVAAKHAASAKATKRTKRQLVAPQPLQQQQASAAVLSHSAPPLASPIALQQQHGGGAQRTPVRRASSADAACPSFSASPKPEALPMPTSGLLSRALAARAGSLSPDRAAGAALLARLQATMA